MLLVVSVKRRRWRIEAIVELGLGLGFRMVGLGKEETFFFSFFFIFGGLRRMEKRKGGLAVRDRVVRIRGGISFRVWWRVLPASVYEMLKGMEMTWRALWCGWVFGCGGGTWEMELRNFVMRMMRVVDPLAKQVIATLNIS